MYILQKKIAFIDFNSGTLAGFGIYSDNDKPRVPYYMLYSKWLFNRELSFSMLCRSLNMNGKINHILLSLTWRLSEMQLQRCWCSLLTRFRSLTHCWYWFLKLKRLLELNEKQLLQCFYNILWYFHFQRSVYFASQRFWWTAANGLRAWRQLGDNAAPNCVNSWIDPQPGTGRVLSPSFQSS